MRVKTNELIGLPLDYAVAVAGDGTGLWFDTVATYWIKIHGKDRALSKGWSQSQCFTPSTDGDTVIDLMEQEWLHVVPWPNEHDEDRRWQCIQHDERSVVSSIGCYGPTARIAVCRCYVAANLGDEVEIPEVLL